MSRPVKYILVAVVALVLCAAVAGIAVLSARYDPDAPDPGLFIKDKKVADPGPMLTIGDNAVSFDVYRHYFLMYRSYFEMYYGAGFFDDDPDGDRLVVLQNAVETELTNAYAWLAIAAEQGTTLSEEELTAINTELAEQKELHGDDFDSYLYDSMLFTSEENYLEVTRMQKLVTKAQDAFNAAAEEEYGAAARAEAEQEYIDNYITAKHILISPVAVEETDPTGGDASVDSDAQTANGDDDTDGDGDTDDHDHEAELAAAQADALARAEDILAEIRAADDPVAKFDELMNEYSEDPGLASYPDGYTFTEGEMVEVFYEAALALEEYGISDPVWSDSGNYSGYHIIMRMPLDAASIETAGNTAATAKVTELRDEKLAAVTDTLPITYGAYYSQFRAIDIH